ncbi:MAG: hypothetical protein GTO22_24135 [Gemmatimonadales bacterium]|nr:hypothetical protein [Gemmatimonadales bacterium]
MSDFNPAVTAYSRVFLIDGRARPDHAPDFQSCLKAGALDWTLGDVEKIECPSGEEYGAFIEEGEIQGAEERPTLPLTGRYASNLASTLLDLARRRCDYDVQVHFGRCTDPRLFNQFTKAIVFEKGRSTNYSTEDLGALASDENAKVDESTDVSGREFYEVLPISYAEKAADVVVNPLVDVVICSTPSCGDCEDEDPGCDKIFAISGSTGGSPGTPPDVVWSSDKGVNWYADDVHVLGASSTAPGIACVNEYVVVISDSDDSLSYKTRADVINAVADAWTEVTTGFVAAGSPADIWSVGNYAFIVGDGGYVYGTSDPTAGVTVLDAGVATTENLDKVHAISDEFAVAVGENGAVVFTEDGSTWAAASSSPSASNLTAVWIKTEDEWWVSTATQLYYTIDQAVTWTAKNLPVTPTDIDDIYMSTDSVMYVNIVYNSLGRIYRSYDGGYSFVNTPEGVASIPAADAYTAGAACTHDANFVVGVGLADDATDGILVVGQD